MCFLSNSLYHHLNDQQNIIILSDGIANWRENTTNWILPTYGDCIDSPRADHPKASDAAINQVINNPGIKVYAVGTGDYNTDFVDKIALKGGTQRARSSRDSRDLRGLFDDLADELIVKGEGTITGLVFYDIDGDGDRDIWRYWQSRNENSY